MSALHSSSAPPQVVVLPQHTGAHVPVLVHNANLVFLFSSRLCFTLCPDCLYLQKIFKTKQTFLQNFDSSGICALDFCLVN